MANTNAYIVVTGNLTSDPELRFTPNGAPVTQVRVASTPRRFNKQTNQYEDGNTLFLAATCWNHLAENVAATLQKGMRVTIVGNLGQREYTTKEGEQRTVYEIEAEHITPNLQFMTGVMTRNPAGGGNNQHQPQQQQGDPWGSQPQQGGDSWGNPGQYGGFGQ